MSDDIDRAQEEVERNLGEALRARRATGPAANGRCHFCEEIVDDTKRWCDSYCRDAWQELPGHLR